MENIITFFKDNTYLLIFLSVPFALIVIWCINLVICQRRGKIYDKPYLQEDLVFQNALRRLNKWLTAATFWMLVEYLCVILPFVANSIVIYLSIGEAHAKEVSIYSVISLGFIVFGYAIKPQLHKQSYRKAYTVLDAAINEHFTKFNNDSRNDDSYRKITEALELGEKEINASYDV